MKKKKKKKGKRLSYKTLVSLLLRIRGSADIVNTFNEIYVVFTSKGNYPLFAIHNAYQNPFVAPDIRLK